MTSDDLRIGYGLDIHPFAKDRKLVIGGESVPYHLGLAGHSDADVLLHAICDSLLGAASKGDIGQHFPDSDPQNRNRSSLDFLRLSCRIIAGSGFRILNIDSVLIGDAPKISEFYPAMRRNIARALEISENQVSVKATTAEGLGFIGRLEGLAAQAVCLLSSGGKEMR